MKKLLVFLFCMPGVLVFGKNNILIQNMGYNNAFVMALNSISETYNHFIQRVNELSSGLPGLEQDPAAAFLAGTYNLVMESYLDKGSPAEAGLTEWMTLGKGINMVFLMEIPAIKRLWEAIGPLYKYGISNSF